MTVIMIKIIVTDNDDAHDDDGVGSDIAKSGKINFLPNSSTWVCPCVV